MPMPLLNRKSEDEAEPPALLEPLRPPMSLFAEYTREKQTDLTIRSKIDHVKNDHFVVTDGGGVPVLKVSAKNWSCKTLKAQPDGTPLFQLNNKNWGIRSILGRTYLLEGEGVQYAKVDRKCATLKITLTARLAVTPSDTQSTQTLQLVGGFTGNRATISVVETGHVVGNISCSYKEAMKNKQTYTASVAPGVDLALVTALVLAWDTCKTEDMVIAVS